MEQPDILIVVTSALFTGADGKRLNEVSIIRLNRLKETMSSLAAYGFKNFVVLDHTIVNSFQLTAYISEMGINLQTIVVEEPIIKFPSNEYQINGPSRLEAALLFQSLTQLNDVVKNYKYVLKISAGYQVKNLRNILNATTNGIVYRMGNPFRQDIKFCLTSFYILPNAYFLALCNFLYAQIPTMSNKKPLEFYMYTYVQLVPHHLSGISYPKLKANFLSSGKSAGDFAYRLREFVFRLLAKLGLYAYQFPS